MKLLLFALTLLLLPALVSAQCTAPGDQEPCDGTVSMAELTDYINLWYGCSSCYPDMFEAIEAYYGILPCVPDPLSVTCGSWICGNRTNNCGNEVSCGTCPTRHYCDNGACIEQQILTNCTMWVEVNGAGNCSESSPCDLATAINIAIPGDIICLSSGYYGEISSSGIDLDGVHNSGYITIQALPGHNPGFRRIRLNNVGYWRFRGLEISPELAPTYSPARFVEILSSSSNNVIIENNNIYSVQDASGWSASTWAGLGSSARYAIFLFGSNIVIRNNTLKNVYHGIVIEGDGALIEYNDIENFAGDGMILGVDNVTIQYNTVKNCYDVDGNHDDMIQAHRGGDRNTPIYNAVIRGNLLIAQDIGEINPLLKVQTQGISAFDNDCPYIGWLVENNVVITEHGNAITVGDTENSIIVNNIVMTPTGNGNPHISVQSDGVNTVIRNNIARSFNTGGTSMTADHNYDVDDYDWNELFVDWQNLDFTHAEGSPAIDAGTCDLAPNIDFLGVSRPQGVGCDIGAYEYEGARACTTPADPSAECDDSNACTNDVCGSDLLCNNQPLSGISCDNGLWCDGVDTCQSGSCSHSGSPCPADSYACTIETCNDATDTCGVTYDNSSCDDSNECTDDSCIGTGGNAGTGCSYSFNTEPCDDGILCTENDACSGGSCQAGTANNSICLIGYDNCTSATCDPNQGCINFVPEGCDVPVVPAGYVSWWRFEGNASDETGTNPGSISGDPQFVTGMQGQALEFDGNDRVDITDNSGLISLPPTYDFSVSAWGRCGATANDRTLWSFSGDDDINLYLCWVSDGPLLANMYWRDLGGNHYYNVPPDTNWHHYVFVSDALDSHNLYVDGQLAVTFTNTGDTGPFTSMHIGSRDTTEYFTGTIDEVIIYNRSLSALEIQQIYDSQQ